MVLIATNYRRAKMTNNVFDNKFTDTKQRLLKPDPDGYYEFSIGGLNVFNGAGEYYSLEIARHHIQSSIDAVPY